MGKRDKCGLMGGTHHPAAAVSAHALPSLYLSHGSPMIAVEPSPTHAFLRWLGPHLEQQFGRPRAVLAVSPHTATGRPTLFAGQRHQAVYDFSGFPQALYDITYEASGSPELAVQAEGLLRSAGIEADVIGRSGLDHGIWTPLYLMWPHAEVPVVPLSLVPTAPPREQWRIGAALAPLRREGVLIVASGSLTHNLQRFFQNRQPLNAAEDAECAAFRHWVWDCCQRRDWAALFDYSTSAPAAARMHPTDEHWLPFYIAAGAGGADEAAVRIHAGVEHGVLAMDAYAFGQEALALRIN